MKQKKVLMVYVHALWMGRGVKYFYLIKASLLILSFFFHMVKIIPIINKNFTVAFMYQVFHLEQLQSQFDFTRKWKEIKVG